MFLKDFLAEFTIFHSIFFSSWWKAAHLFGHLFTECDPMLTSFDRILSYTLFRGHSTAARGGTVNPLQVCCSVPGMGWTVYLCYHPVTTPSCRQEHWPHQPCAVIFAATCGDSAKGLHERVGSGQKTNVVTQWAKKDTTTGTSLGDFEHCETLFVKGVTSLLACLGRPSRGSLWFLVFLCFGTHRIIQIFASTSKPNELRAGVWLSLLLSLLW